MTKNNEKKTKVKEAAALKYVQGEDISPKIVALGRGDTADRIIEKAKDSKVPLYEDPVLAHTLNYLNIGDQIPQELYEAVAEVLVFVAALDNRFDDFSKPGE